jgi:hypothetical protein
VTRGLEQAGAVGGGDVGQERAIGDDPLQHRDGGAQVVEERSIDRRGGHARI